MTHHTDAERAEFERTVADEMYGGLIELIIDHWDSVKGEYKLFQHQVAWIAWQAARRARAAQVPLRKPTVDQVSDAIGYHASAWDCVGPRELIDAILMLAAAPQPPEAAPVVLPEPVAWRDPTNLSTEQSCTYQKWKRESWPHIYTQALYTDQQVRELLENHGIKVAP